MKATLTQKGGMVHQTSSYDDFLNEWITSHNSCYGTEWIYIIKVIIQTSEFLGILTWEEIAKERSWNVYDLTQNGHMVLGRRTISLNVY